MINFLKEYSYSIFKMFVNQLGMMIFGLVLSMATWQNDWLFLGASIFGAIFYMVLLYTMTWDIGYAEKIRIDAKRMKYSPLKGLYMSLAANSLNFLLAIFAIVGYYGGGTLEGGPVWAINMYGIAKSIAVFIQGMYSGIVGTLFPTNPWGLIAIIVPSLAVCTLAYLAGVEGFRLTPFGGPKESKE